MMNDLINNKNSNNIIKFSGNMYKSDINIIDTEYEEQIIQNIDLFYINNKVIIDDIFMSKNQVIIFDFAISGLSLLTFKRCIKLINEKYFHNNDFDKFFLEKIHFVIISVNEQFHKVVSNIKDKVNFSMVSIDNLDNFVHFGNSDNTKLSALCSRCVPKFLPTEWFNPNNIFIDTNNEENYIGCNINNVYIYAYINFLFRDDKKMTEIKEMPKFGTDNEYIYMETNKISQYKNILGDIFEPSNELEIPVYKINKDFYIE